MANYTRRDTLKNITSGLAGVAIVSAITPRPALAQSQVTIPNAFTINHEIVPLGFEPGKLEGLSEKLITSHWQNNYGGSVKALNIIRQRLRDALADDNLPAYIYNDLKREHLLRTGSVVLHEYYFDNLSPPTDHDSELDHLLTQAFGSVNSWDKEFRRIGTGLGGGSGWVMLAWNIHTKTLENYWTWDHMHSPVASIPILVMDMYEHSYQMDYGANAVQYIDAFMKNINWTKVALRLNNAITLKL